MNTAQEHSSRTQLNGISWLLRFTLFLLGMHLEAASVVQFSTTSYPIAENGSTATIIVERTDDLATAVSVDYATVDGTATAGSDYTKVTGSLNFVASETRKTFSVTILNDGVVEPAETFQVILTNPTAGATLGPRATANVRVADNHRGIQVEILTYSVNEDAGSIAVAVIRGSDEDFPASVDFATVDGTAKAGQDYAETKGRLDFATKERRKLVSIPVLNDALKETDKTFRFAISNPSGPTTLGKPQSASIKIKDNDLGLSFSRAIYSVPEDAGEVTVTVVRGNDVDTPPFTVDYATADQTALADTDYKNTFGTLSFSAAETSKSFTVSIINNGLRQPSRTLRLT